MKQDAKTFLITVLGVPLFLGAVWGINAGNEARVVEFKREHVAEAKPETVAIPETVATVELPAAHATATVPIAVQPVPKAVVVRPVAQPATNSPPVVVEPVVPKVVEPPPEPAPKPVVVKKSRRTRAS